MVTDLQSQLVFCALGYVHVLLKSHLLTRSPRSKELYLFSRLPPGHDPGSAVRELPHPVHLADLADGDEVADEAEAGVADVRRHGSDRQTAAAEGRGGGYSARS